MRPALLLLLVAGCSIGPSENTPQGQCQAQANSDPAVKKFYTETPGLYTTSGDANQELKSLREQAYLRCMRQKGLAPPGGVAPVVKTY